MIQILPENIADLNKKDSKVAKRHVFNDGWKNVRK